MNDQITYFKIAKRLPTILCNLPGLIKGSRMSKITDTTKPIGLGLAFEQTTQRHPKFLALIFRNRQFSYEKMNRWANRLAHYLSAQGLVKGDVVAINMENRPELMATTLTCAKLGLCGALINTSQRQQILVHSFNLVKPKACIVGDEQLGVMQDVRDELNLDKPFYYFSPGDTLCDTLSNPSPAPHNTINLAREIIDSLEHNPSSTQ